MQRRRAGGIIPSARLRLHGEDVVSGLADQVTTALRDAIGGRSVDERLAAVGLLGALGQLPTVFSLGEASRHHRQLEGLVDRGMPPITGMREVIDIVLSVQRSNYERYSVGG